MKTLLAPVILLFVAIGVSVLSCVHPPQVQPSYGNFPTSIGKILVEKCAISGCHNAASYQNCDGLLLDSWEHLFRGGEHGAAVVPYSTKYSPMLYYCNTDSSLGVVAKPTMPYSTTARQQSPLSRAEYDTLVAWIAKGAPDANGNIPFASNADKRQKIYVTQQGCNLVAVIDAGSKQIMRYIDVSSAPGGSAKSPHGIAVSNDGMSCYVPFMASAYIDKIDTRTDAVVGYANVGATIGSGGDNTNGGWSIISVAPNDSSLMVSGYYCNNLVNVTTSSMLVNQSLSIDARSGYPPAPWSFPHGVAHNATFDTFYVALQWGNAVARVSVNPTTHRLTYKFIGVNGLAPASTSSADSFSPNPHFVQMAPDYKKYFVTCQGTNKVVVMNTANDSILKTIDVGAYPQEMTTYKEANELYVSCLEDGNSTFTGALGSIYVIDMNTLEVKNVIYGDFYQPHDMAVDGIDGYLYVVSTNYSPTGPPPHHVTGCGPKAGWYTVVDLATHRQLDTRRYEMTYYPYAAAVRFAK